MHDDQKISVIVAAYNAASTLETSMASVLGQTHDNLEIIVADDCSRDETVTVAKRIATADPRLKIVSCAVNGGPAAARNAAIDAATGAWIAVVDADDIILPARLGAMLSTGMAAQADIVFDNLIYIANDGKGAGVPYIADTAAIAGPLPLSLYIASHRKSNPVPNLGFLKPMIRKSALDRLGLRYDTGLKIGEDAMLIMDLLAGGASAILLPDAYYQYERHDGSISARQSIAHLAAINDSYRAFVARNAGRLDQASQDAMAQLIADNDKRLLARRFVDDLVHCRLGSAAARAVKGPSPSLIARECLSLARHGLRSRR